MQRIVTIVMVFALVFALPCDAFAKAKKKAAAPSENNKYASIVIDAATGAVLSEKNANKVLHPASLTKVMTLMLLFDALEAGTVRLNDRIYISQHAANQQPSKLGLAAGSSIRVEDAILAIVTKSANDMSTAVAEHLAGSESRFAARMTQRAHQIGMTRTNFVNAHGLHNPAQVSTARDMATLARYIIVRYPNYYRYFSTKQFTYRGKTMTNHNRLMQTYPGMDGFKTGFINASGFNLIASAKHGNTRLIGVVFGGKSWKSRNDHMASLLDTNFAKVRNGTAYAAKDSTPVTVAAATPAAAPPAPAIKPVYRETTITTVTTGAAPQAATSLSALNAEPRKLVLPPPAAPAATPQASAADRAVANAEAAINRGEYSELTGEGDYDAINARRVETGLIAAAVYKGDHERVREIQQAAALQPSVGTPQPQAQPGTLQAPAGVQPVSVPANTLTLPTPAASNLWSVQIGAYNSRVATDEALRTAHTRLPADLYHASPIVVPLTTQQGVLFRARFGNLTQAQAQDACRYFRDCIPVAPR